MAAAEPRGGRDLFEDRVSLDRESRGPASVGPVRRLVELGVEFGDPAAVLGQGAAIDEFTSVGFIDAAARVAGGHVRKVEGGDRNARVAKQRAQMNRR